MLHLPSLPEFNVRDAELSNVKYIMQLVLHVKNLWTNLRLNSKSILLKMAPTFLSLLRISLSVIMNLFPASQKAKKRIARH